MSSDPPEGLVGGEAVGVGPVMTLTMVWMLEAATEPALAMVEGNTKSGVCSAAASVCACDVAWETCAPTLLQSRWAQVCRSASTSLSKGACMNDPILPDNA